MATLTVDIRFPDDDGWDEDGGPEEPSGRAFVEWVRELMEDNGVRLSEMLPHELCNWEFSVVLGDQAMHIHAGAGYQGHLGEFEEDEEGLAGPWELMIEDFSIRPFRKRSTKLKTLATHCLAVQRIIAESSDRTPQRIAWRLMIDSWFRRSRDVDWDPNHPLDISKPAIT